MCPFGQFLFSVESLQQHLQSPTRAKSQKSHQTSNGQAARRLNRFIDKPSPIGRISLQNIDQFFA
jgi:hypothetical protein